MHACLNQLVILHFSFDGNRVSTVPSSNYEHYVTSLGRLQNTPIVVGGDHPKNKKVEVLQSGSWKELADFPFVDEAINSYSMVTFEDSLYLFGSFCFRFHNSIYNLFIIFVIIIEKKR